MEKKSISTVKVISTVFLAIVSLIIAQVIARIPRNFIIELNIPKGVADIVFSMLYVIMAYFSLKLLCKKLLNIELSHCRIKKSKVGLVWIISGILLPSLVSIVMLFFPGELVQNDMNLEQIFNIICFAVFSSGLGAGLVEEMVFRGVIMKVLETHFGRGIAIVVPSAIFGLLHATGGMSFLDIILLFIAGISVGIMFSLIAYESGTILSSAVVHAFWNIIIIGGILNIGNKYSSEAIFSYKLSNQSFLITGGEFGIEASLVAVIGYISVCLLALLLIKRNKKHKYRYKIKDEK